MKTWCGLVASLLLAACSSSTPSGSNPAEDGGVDADSGALDASDANCEAGRENGGPYSLVTIAGNGATKGAIDPSVVYAAGAAEGFMTYTAVPDEAHDYIAIASSSNAGASWQYTGDVTAPTLITIAATDMGACGAATCSGTLIHESSSLVLDPADPDPNGRFKVFVHSYFFDTQRHLELGYLALYSAPAAQGPWSETKLFGWDSDSTISSDGVRYNVRHDPALPELHGCYIVGEPGALYREPGILDLTLSCVAVSAGGATIDVRLLRSLDHGQTWSVVSTLLGADDAAALGSTVPQVNGSALMTLNGRYYVIVSPTGTVDFPGGSGDGYRGCVVVPIADIETGEVERCSGNPVVTSAYRGQPGQFVGACSAAEGATANGMLIPVPDLSAAPNVSYLIYAAGEPLP